MIAQFKTKDGNIEIHGQMILGPIGYEDMVLAEGDKVCMVDFHPLENGYATIRWNDESARMYLAASPGCDWIDLWYTHERWWLLEKIEEDMCLT